MSEKLPEPATVRISEAHLEVAGRLKERLSKKASGAKVTRSEVLRLAVERGLRELERELSEAE